MDIYTPGVVQTNQFIERLPTPRNFNNMPMDGNISALEHINIINIKHGKKKIANLI